MDPNAEDVLSRPAPPPDDTRPYAAGPAHVYDVRFPASRPRRRAGEEAGREHSTHGAPATTQSSAQIPSPGTVLVVHGGFWREAYDRSHAAPQAAGLAEAGWHVAVGEYRRAGMEGGGWPGTFDDIAALVDAVAHDPDLPGPLYLMGHSAGGHLVAWAANQPWATTVTAAVVLAGCVDLATTDRLHLGADAARDFLGDPADAPDAWRAADPVHSLPPRCPVRLVHGELDRTVPVSVTDTYLHEAERLDADITLDVVADAGHFSLIDPEHPAWQHTLGALKGMH